MDNRHPNLNALSMDGRVHHRLESNPPMPAQHDLQRPSLRLRLQSISDIPPRHRPVHPLRCDHSQSQKAPRSFRQRSNPKHGSNKQSKRQRTGRAHQHHEHSSD